jgi:hypothetical protein
MILNALVERPTRQSKAAQDIRTDGFLCDWAPGSLADALTLSSVSYLRAVMGLLKAR